MRPVFPEQQINLTNAVTALEDGTPVTVAIANRDALKMQRGILTQVADAASPGSTYDAGYRRVNKGADRVDGQLEERDGRRQLRFERGLSHVPAKVWRALTEPEHLVVWFPADIEGDRAAGASLRFVFRHGEGPTIDGEMIVYTPPSVLEFRWGEELFRFELEPDGEGTLLVFVNTFDELGKAARDATGWDVSLEVLAYHLNGEAAPWTPRDRWQQLHPSYVERFGPDASTIGPPASRPDPE